MMPMFTSGWPSSARSEAIRMSHARASSQPPPSAKRLIAAMIGLLHAAIVSPSRRPISEKRCISRPVRFAISLISAPAANARSPAPVRMIAPTSWAIERCSIAIDSSRRTAALSAFNASGRLIVTIARRSSISILTNPGMGTSPVARMRGMRMNILRGRTGKLIRRTYTRGPKVGCLQTRHRVLAGAIGLLLVAGLLALAMPARANMDRPTWSVGNFWVYNVTSGTGPGQTSGTLRLDVAGTESAVVNGTSYSTYHLTASLVEGILTIPADIWFSTDTLAIVKISSAFDVVPGNASTRVSVSISGNPPQTIQWPLTTDATWTSATTVWAGTTFQ